MEEKSLYKLIRPLVILCYLVLAILALKYLMSHVIGWFMPFIIAFFVSRFALPISRGMVKKLRFRRTPACIVSTIIVMLLCLLIVGLIVFFIYLRLVPFFKDLSVTYASASEQLSSLWDDLLRFLDRFPPAVSDAVSKAISQIPQNIDFYGLFGRPLLNAASSLPVAILSVVATVVSSFFFTIYNDAVSRFIRAFVPESIYEKVVRTYRYLFSSLFNWLKAQCILCSICLFELFVGFLIMGFKNAFLLAFLIALIDFLPVLGAGAVLIPWALIALLLGSYKLALSLAVLYVVILVVRNLLEPHVVAHQIGLHPLVTLMGIYVGFRMFGFAGMFIVPLILLCIIKLNEWGYIHFWKTDAPPDPKNEILSVEPEK